MPLSSSTRLGAYEIVSFIGAGGMGEVYRARDTRLNRIVALKTLLEPLSGSAQLRERFEREEHAIASLSHPHICALYDIGSHNGIHFLVMEYLEGEVLAQRIKGVRYQLARPSALPFKSLMLWMKRTSTELFIGILSSET